MIDFRVLVHASDAPAQSIDLVKAIVAFVVWRSEASDSRARLRSEILKIVKAACPYARCDTTGERSFNILLDPGEWVFVSEVIK